MENLVGGKGLGENSNNPPLLFSLANVSLALEGLVELGRGLEERKHGKDCLTKA